MYFSFVHTLYNFCYKFSNVLVVCILQYTIKSYETLGPKLRDTTQFMARSFAKIKLTLVSSILFANHSKTKLH